MFVPPRPMGIAPTPSRIKPSAVASLPSSDANATTNASAIRRFIGTTQLGGEGRKSVLFDEIVKAGRIGTRPRRPASISNIVARWQPLAELSLSVFYARGRICSACGDDDLEPSNQ